jgi:small subunit ribosomal protein S4e
MHLKRNKVPVTWPLERKGTKYLIVPQHNFAKGIPLLVALRDVLNIVQNRKEAKKALYDGKIKINHKLVREEKFPLSLFDILSVGKQNYKVIIENRRFNLEEINEKDASEKIVKVIGKTALKKGKIQINLSDGRNFITKEKHETGDSVLIDLKENKIKKSYSPKKGSKVIVLKGKHFGQAGTIEEMEKEGITEVHLGKEKVKINIGNLMVTE